MQPPRTLFFLYVLFVFTACQQDDPAPFVPDNLGEVYPERTTIQVHHDGDTLTFESYECVTEDTLTSMIISEAPRQDSFGLTRRTIMRTPDTVACEWYELGLGLDIKDGLAHYPVNRYELRKHLERLRLNTGTDVVLQVRLEKGCRTYQNYERLFNEHSQLYTFSRNPHFAYKVTDYELLTGETCGYDLLETVVRLEGWFQGRLYTTPNVVNRDSIEVNCERFEVFIFHERW